jgi:hypothetical protein
MSQTTHDLLQAWMPQLSGDPATLTSNRVRLTMDDNLAIDLELDAKNATLWLSHSFGSPLAARDMPDPLGLLQRSRNDETPFRSTYAMDPLNDEVALCLPLSIIGMTSAKFEVAALWFIDRTKADRMQFGVA